MLYEGHLSEPKNRMFRRLSIFILQMYINFLDAEVFINETLEFCYIPLGGMLVYCKTHPSPSIFSMTLYIQPKISVQPLKMEMGCTDQT